MHSALWATSDARGTGKSDQRFSLDPLVCRARRPKSCIVTKYPMGSPCHEATTTTTRRSRWLLESTTRQTINTTTLSLQGTTVRQVLSFSSKVSNYPFPPSNNNDKPTATRQTTGKQQPTTTLLFVSFCCSLPHALERKERRSNDATKRRPDNATTNNTTTHGAQGPEDTKVDVTGRKP